MKQFAVIGLGYFGVNVAKALMKKGCQVIAIDEDEEKIQDASSWATQAIQADATEEKNLRSLDIQEMDGVIVGIGENMEASIMISLLLKELGVKNIIVKGINLLQGKVLRKIGVDRIIFPERDIAERLADFLVTPRILEEITLLDDYKIAQILVPKEFVGKTLGKLDLKYTYRINIIAIKKKIPIITDSGETDFKEEINISPQSKDEIEDGDILVILGKEKYIKGLRK